MSASPWTPDSWQKFPILQQPTYPDQGALRKALEKVKSLPPLVHAKEIDALKAHLAECAAGRAFLIQGGDCAERFIDCSQEPIEAKFKILLQMSLIVLFGSKKRVVRLARMAGQFAKPRSSEFEPARPPTPGLGGADGQAQPAAAVYSFKGDNVNSIDPADRTPDPDRLVQAYFHSAATLNYLRAMIAGGVANLHHPQQWNLAFVRSDPVKRQYEDVITKILESFTFLKAIGADEAETFKTIDLYTCHEGLLLNYEAALTKQVNDVYYNLGTHFLWIGDRTRQLNGAHIEYFRGISNPIGIKVGPSMASAELATLVQVLNPGREAGRLTLITRYGCAKVAALLPTHIAAVRATGIPVLWICDPCHGNTETTADGVKTRRYGKMLDELLQTFDVHRAAGSVLGGVHFELAGEDVTECLGGSSELEEQDLSTNYTSFCDPRLNYTQSLDMAFSITAKLKEESAFKT